MRVSAFTIAMLVAGTDAHRDHHNRHKYSVEKPE